MIRLAVAADRLFRHFAAPSAVLDQASACTIYLRRLPPQTAKRVTTKASRRRPEIHAQVWGVRLVSASQHQAGRAPRGSGVERIGSGWVGWTGEHQQTEEGSGQHGADHWFRDVTPTQTLQLFRIFYLKPFSSERLFCAPNIAIQTSKAKKSQYRQLVKSAPLGAVFWMRSRIWGRYCVL
jgi:hypothetical protein